MNDKISMSIYLVMMIPYLMSVYHYIIQTVAQTCVSIRCEKEKEILSQRE